MMFGGSARPLTTGEREMGRSVFADSLDWERIRLVRGGVLVLFADGVAIRNRIYLHARVYRPDYAAADVRLTLRALLIHELMHVWQFQNLREYHWSRAGLEHLRHYGGVYEYRLAGAGEAVHALLDYRYEQQGRLLQDYYMLRELGRDVSAYEAVLAAGPGFGVHRQTGTTA